jgi:hypothetical protein
MRWRDWSVKPGKPPKTAVASALKKLNADPIAELVAIARAAKDKTADHRLLTVRAKVWSELLQYCNPKLRAIELEVTGGKGKPVQLAFDWDALLRPSGGE